MTTEQVGLGAACAVALVALVVALLAHRRARRAEALAASLAEHVAVPSGPVAQAPPVAESDTAAFVITQVEPNGHVLSCLTRRLLLRLITKSLSTKEARRSTS